MAKKIFFENSRGDRLCGILSGPVEKKYSPIVIMCHGFSTSKDGRTYTRLEKILNNYGLSTFRFDFFGHGESEGRFEEVTISEAVDDITRALEFLQDRDFMRFGLVGSSFGGMASILAASGKDGFDVLALKSPVSDYMGLLIAHDHGIDISAWKERGAIPVIGADGQSRQLKYSFFEDGERIRGYEAVKKIKIPALIIHGSRDETVPLEQSQISAGLMNQCRLEIIQGADHIYSQPLHFEKMLEFLSQFIIDYYR